MAVRDQHLRHDLQHRNPCRRRAQSGSTKPCRMGIPHWCIRCRHRLFNMAALLPCHRATLDGMSTISQVSVNVLIHMHIQTLCRYRHIGCRRRRSELADNAALDASRPPQ
ncbi:hypothetical protein GCM10027214_12760 [Stenotrophomonas tumulicola]